MLKLSDWSDCAHNEKKTTTIKRKNTVLSPSTPLNPPPRLHARCPAFLCHCSICLQEEWGGPPRTPRRFQVCRPPAVHTAELGFQFKSLTWPGGPASGWVKGSRCRPRAITRSSSEPQQAADFHHFATKHSASFYLFIHSCVPFSFYYSFLPFFLLPTFRLMAEGPLSLSRWPPLWHFNWPTASLSPGLLNRAPPPPLYFFFLPRGSKLPVGSTASPQAKPLIYRSIYQN